MDDALHRIYLARQGETEWSATGQHTGLTDLPLTPQGERNALRLSDRLKPLPFAVLLTTPLQRARRTCELAGYGGLAVVDPDLVEWNYGDYEGRRTVDIRNERPSWNLFHDGCPNGETAAQLGARADRVIVRLRAVDGNVLVFSHRHFLSVLAARWVGLPPDKGGALFLSETSVSVLSYNHTTDEPVIQQWNA